MTGYAFHPEAALDLDEIWEFIARDNLDAADNMIADVLTALDKLMPFPIRAINGQTSPRAPCDLFWSMHT